MATATDALWVALRENKFLLIPDYNPPEYGGKGEGYPGGIVPGQYSRKETVGLLRTHKNNPEAVQFLADMLED